MSRVKTQSQENKNIPLEIIWTHWELTGLNLEQTFSPVNHKKYQQVCYRLLYMVEMIVLFYVSMVVVEFLMLTQHRLVIIPLAIDEFR